MLRLKFRHRIQATNQENTMQAEIIRKFLDTSRNYLRSENSSAGE